MNIKELARIAGVSVATVSKVLNNKDSSISVETRQRVLQLAKEYQYSPYASHINSAAQNSYTIALLADFSDPAYGPAARGIEAVLSKNGYSMLVFNSGGSHEKTMQSLHIVCSRNLNALIILPCGSISDEMLAVIREMAFPVVVLNAYRTELPCMRISLDYHSAACTALDSIVHHGHQKIGCILDQNSVHSSEILEAYTHFCYENDIRFDAKYVFHSCGGFEGGQAGFKQLIHYGVSAILCQDESIAKGVYTMAQTFGAVIPDELSIVSMAYDNSPSLLYPELCTVRISSNKLGEYAASILIDSIEKGLPLTGSKVIDACEFHPGKSLAAWKGVSSTKSRVVVVGSMNMDIIIHVSSFPQPGETVMSPLVAKIPGGKGANQAVGVGKLGGNVYMIGRIGNDQEGKMLYQSLYENNVNLDGVSIEDDFATGKAFIHVDNSGESTIVVYPGANSKLTPSHVLQRASLFEQAQYCLISTETLPETVKTVVSVANQNSVRVVMKPSAVSSIDKDMLEGLYLLVPNEKEINCLLPDSGMTLEEKARYFLSCGVRNVIVTLGEKGCMLCNHEETVYFPAADFQAVDTTGAADSFISALVVSLSETQDLHYAIRFATYAAGITITREGVQPALPDRMMMRLYADKIKD